MFSSKCKFLLDENVRYELYQFLKEKGVDVVKVSRGLKNGKVAQLSLKEKRILVTNDGDFAHISSRYIYGVVWLRLPQNDAKGLIQEFEKLFTEHYHLSGRLIVIRQDGIDVISLT